MSKPGGQIRDGVFIGAHTPKVIVDALRKRWSAAHARLSALPLARLTVGDLAQILEAKDAWCRYDIYEGWWGACVDAEHIAKMKALATRYESKEPT